MKSLIKVLIFFTILIILTKTLTANKGDNLSIEDSTQGSEISSSVSKDFEERSESTVKVLENATRVPPVMPGVFSQDDSKNVVNLLKDSNNRRYQLNESENSILAIEDCEFNVTFSFFGRDVIYSEFLYLNKGDKIYLADRIEQEQKCEEFLNNNPKIFYCSIDVKLELIDQEKNEIITTSLDLK